jgi:catechol 2,3-dioxygenase-like lactoylglutathione lyase family enzyme
MTSNTTRFGHVVLWASDPLAAADFYEETVGLEPLGVAEFAEGKMSFPSVRVNDETILDLAPVAMAEHMTMFPGSADSASHPVDHICLALPSDEFDALRALIQEHDVPVSQIARDASGTCGNTQRSFYFRDSDGNVTEARHYA